MAEKTEAKKVEREYIIPLRRAWNKVPRYKRANKAIRTIKEFLVRHMRIRDRNLNKIKIDKYLNEMVWFRGIRKPPFKIKVKVVKENDIVKVELSELSDKLKFKKARHEKRDKLAEEAMTKKKAAAPEETKEKPAKESVEKTEEEKKEEKEKIKAGEEAMQKLEKTAARRTKHQTKIQKQPKHLQRKALEK